MERLFIQGNATLPTIDFKLDGNLILEGKALPEDAHKVFAPIFEWIEKFDAEKMVFDVNLYYFNTAVSKQLYEMFNKAVNNENVKHVLVKWRYEEGDDDTHEAGLIYRDEIPKAEFEFYVYAEI